MIVEWTHQPETGHAPSQVPVIGEPPPERDEPGHAGHQAAVAIDDRQAGHGLTTDEIGKIIS